MTASTELRDEAVALLLRLADLETDPGAKGYSEDMAQRLRESYAPTVDQAYVYQLRSAVSKLETAAVKQLQERLERLVACEEAAAGAYDWEADGSTAKREAAQRLAQIGAQITSVEHEIGTLTGMNDAAGRL